MESLLGLLGGSVVGSVVTWLLYRKKYDAEIIGTELHNVNTAIEIWKQTANELKEQVTQLKNEVGELKSLVNKLHNENKELKKQLNNNNKNEKSN
jgi:peptidoglycan hydrolase CwlO-like protein